MQQILLGGAPGYVVEAKLWGASGGSSQNCGGQATGRGGGGGFVHAKSNNGTLTPGTTLYIKGGHKGKWNHTGTNYGGGGAAGGSGGGSGGGGTFLATGSNFTSGNMLLVAGGGSGGGGGRGGGGSSGQNGGSGANGGTQNNGGGPGTGGYGNAPSGQAGGWYQGGTGSSCKGSGGGGGWYGGGGGAGDCGSCSNGQAGGGSGYLKSATFNETVHFQTTGGWDTPGRSDPDWANNAGYSTGAGDGNHGRLVLLVNGAVVGTWGYEGAVRSYTLQ